MRMTWLETWVLFSRDVIESRRGDVQVWQARL